MRLYRDEHPELPAEIKYLEIRSSKLEKYKKLFHAYSVKKFLKHDSLQERIIEKIKSKEEKAKKSYLSYTKDDDLWLIIRIKDGTVLTNEIEKMSFNYTSKYFNRVYLQLNFQPDAGDYPLIRII